MSEDIDGLDGEQSVSYTNTTEIKKKVNLGMLSQISYTQPKLHTNLFTSESDDGAAATSNPDLYNSVKHKKGGNRKTKKNKN